MSEAIYVFGIATSLSLLDDSSIYAFFAQLAQWLEYLLDMQEVAGSSPALGTKVVVSI